MKRFTNYVILKEPRKFILRGELKNLANLDPSLALLPAPDAGANAPVLIVGNFDVAYDYVRQYSS